MSEENKNLTQNEGAAGTPNPGTKAAIQAELDTANAKLAAAEAELEKLKTAQAQGGTEGAAPTTAPKAEERVKLFIPRGASNEDPNLFIGVNGVNYLLPRGKESMVPACVAAEYQRSVRAQERLDKSRDQLLEAAKQ